MYLPFMMRTQQEYLHRLDELSGGVRAIVLEFAAYYTRVQTNTALALLRKNQDSHVAALMALLEQQQGVIDRLTAREREVGT